MAIPTISDVAGVIAEPQLTYTHSGKAVLSLRFAFNDSRYDEQSRQWENTRSFYVDGSAWEQKAERLAETIRQGDQVYVEGRLETQEWEKDGQKRSKPHLVVRTVRKLEKAQNAPQQAQQQGGYAHGGQPQDHPNWGAAPNTAWGGGQQQGQGNTPPPF